MKTFREYLDEASEPKDHVVIGNAGRGRQNMWPNSDEPTVHTKSEAEAIASKLNGPSTGVRYGHFQVHYHAKHVDDAHNYIASGQPAHYGLKKLKASLGRD